MGGRAKKENLIDMDLHAAIRGTSIVGDKFSVWIFPVMLWLICLPTELEQHVIAGGIREEAFLPVWTFKKSTRIKEVKASPIFIYFSSFFKSG